MTNYFLLYCFDGSMKDSMRKVQLKELIILIKIILLALMKIDHAVNY